MDRAAALALADVVLDYRSNSYVEAARSMAQFLKRDEEDRRQLVDSLSACQARATQLLEDRRTLCRLIERMHARMELGAGESETDEMLGLEALVREAVTACAGMP